jgi:phosphate transport system protein
LRGRPPSLQTSGSSSPSSASTCTSETLVELDELIDRANRNATEDVLSLGDSPAEREYGLRMLVVSRCVERIGDHAVDIGEQVAYLVTGEFREFSDASHPA